MKKLYKTKYVVEVLSEEPMPDPISLETILYDITDGQCSGVIKGGVSKVISSKKVIEEIEAQGTDPEFFGFVKGVDKESIKTFLDKFCTKVRKNEKSDYVELMMDNHFCIQYGKSQYYVPENNMLFTELDESIQEFLEKEYRL